MPSSDLDRDPRARRTTEALLGAAEEIFGRRNPEDVTVEEIAERAGVAVGSIYNHFGSKAALHAATVELALDLDRVYMDCAYTPERSPVEQITAAGVEYLRFYFDHPEYFRMLAFPPDPGHYPAGGELMERLARRVDDQNARLVQALREGIEEGSIRAVNPQRTATAMWAALNGIISLAWRPDDLREDAAGLKQLMSIISKVIAIGIAPRPEDKKNRAVDAG